MNIDKDNLFRNATPGFVFILVILSFYASSGLIKASFNTATVSILTIAAGFPIGFILQSIHRMAIHTFLGERENMQKNEYEEFKKDRPERNHEEFSQTVAFELNDDKNKKYRERIDFLNTYFHALGGSAVAILAAIIFLQYWFPFKSLCKNSSCLDIVWFIVWIILCYGRIQVRKEYDLCRKIFIRETMILKKKTA